MFNPKYNISPKLLENIKRISVEVARLNEQRYDWAWFEQRQYKPKQ